MNETMNSILSRRSVRAFSPDPIPDDVLTDIVDAALHAPTAKNHQSWKFTVITNKDVIEKLRQVIGEAFNNPNYTLHDPAAVIITSNQADFELSKEDNACALENIFIAAQSYGVGSCWINQMRNICSDPGPRAFLDEIAVPADHNVYGMAILGYPAEDFEPRPKEIVGQVSWIK